MKPIKGSELKVNRTALYLLPGLREYGSSYRENLSMIHKLAFGIKDEADEREGNNLYILMDSSVNTKTFIRVLNWVKTQPYYIADYEFDDMLDGVLHMVVLHVPNNRAYDNFMLSKYSKMYDASDLKKFIGDDSIILGVLTRDEETTKRYVDEINEEWGTKFEASEWTGELDYPWKHEEEVFEVVLPRKKRESIEGINTLETSGIEEVIGEVRINPADDS